MRFKKIKICIALLWFVLFSILLYGMIFISSRSFEEEYYAFDVLLVIFFMGFSSIFLEKLHENITITYFLLWYFGMPILFTISINYSLWFKENRIHDLNDLILYIGLFLFVFVSILGFIFYAREKYKKFIICFIVCAFLYLFHLPFALIALSEPAK